MRILTAEASNAGDSVADVLASWSPAVAAVTSISPTDACTVATRLALRYAVQCWDVPRAGKAVFWKPVLPLQGVFRTEFLHRDESEPSAPSGALRVTLEWDGNPLHVLCAQLSSAAHDADWQLVQIARELSTAQGPAFLAVDAGGAGLPVWPAFSDVWSAAHWRSIEFPEAFDAGDAARSAFGLSTAAAPTTSPGVSSLLGARRVRLFCSEHFSVVRARHVAWIGSSDAYPLIADVTSRANGVENFGNAGSNGSLSRAESYSQS